jgi:alanyl-tRNA synthetase
MMERIIEMNHYEVRRTFIEYFARHGHRVVRSSGLIPHGDPTLMFTNAGMNQFKNVFLGLEKRDYSTATSSQKCLRVTGKHNDFEQVGRTARHHTFFEMLGNFSFGDYFKREAIRYAWELMAEGYGLDPERLYATVYKDDDEAYRIWEEEIGIPTDRLFRLGKKDNYWAMGDTGPNGPCSELHYDMKPPKGRLRTPEEVERGGDDAFVELWNLVFMQFNTREDGVTEPLPKPSVDTGAGLERIAAVKQGVISNYDTDLFKPYIEAVAELASIDYGPDKEGSVSARVIADHLRAMTFLISDGAMPSNEGRGYVLRRIIRRAIRHGRLVGLHEPFLYRLCGLVAERMGEVYPELPENRDYVAKVVQSEEQRFGRAFESSYRYFYDEGIKPAKETGGEIVPAEVVFRAYDTFGMPLDLAIEIASEHGMTVDEHGFRELLEGQREKARASWKGSGEGKTDPVLMKVLDEFGPTDFRGYDAETVENAKVIALVKGGKRVKKLTAGDEGLLVLDATPFYGESGGQVGDTGRLHGGGASAAVEDTLKIEGALHVHKVKVTAGEIAVGIELIAEVDHERRSAIRANHTVTHIMQWALRDILGLHVKQAGSLVAPDRVRFDFTHFSAMTPRELDLFEKAVNRRIREDAEVRWEVKDLDEAIGEGVTALFGEKYEERVRVIRTGDFSAELCGGTHVTRTGQIGLFHILSEGSVAAGVRRIEAVTGEAAVRRVQAERDLIAETSGLLKTTPEGITSGVERLLKESKALHKEIAELKVKAAGAGAAGGGPAYKVTEVADYKIATQLTTGLDPSSLKNLADEIRSKIKSGVVLLGDESEGKATLVLAATKDLEKKIDCGKLIREIAKLIGGGGGGSPSMAQAGGKDAGKLTEALDEGREIVTAKLK